MLELECERQERCDRSPSRALAIRCALALGCSRQVVDMVRRADVIRSDLPPLEWMRLLLNAEESSQRHDAEPERQLRPTLLRA